MMTPPVIPLTNTLPALPRVGVILGAKTALWLSPLFILLFFTALHVLESVLSREVSFSNVGRIPVVFLVFCLMGVFPAMGVGAIGGGIIGWLFQSFQEPLPPFGAFSTGVAVVFGVLLGPTLWLGIELLKPSLAESRVDGMQLFLMGGLPALFVLGGLGWVAYRVNEKCRLVEAGEITKC